MNLTIISVEINQTNGVRRDKPLPKAVKNNVRVDFINIKGQQSKKINAEVLKLEELITQKSK